MATEWVAGTALLAMVGAVGWLLGSTSGGRWGWGLVGPREEHPIRVLRRDEVKPTVLVVTEDAAAQASWTSWLEHAGFATTTCPGPSVVRGCPRARGNPCMRREVADVAVVDVDTAGEMGTNEGCAERFCTTIPVDGRTLFAERNGRGGAAANVVATLIHPTKDTLVAAVKAARAPAVAGQRAHRSHAADEHRIDRVAGPGPRGGGS